MPLGRDVVLTVRVGGAIVSVRVTGLVCTGEPESCTEKVIDEFVTVTVGVPEITPVAAANDSPVGNAPLVMLQE